MYLITGDINTGKSTKTYAYSKNFPMANGFISIKTMSGIDVYKYDLLELKTKESVVLAYKDPYFQSQFKSTQSLGEYHFSDDAFQWAEKRVDEWLTSHVYPIFIDEVGKLELEGYGFHQIIIKIINYKHDCYFTIREAFIPEFIIKYQIKTYSVLNL